MVDDTRGVTIVVVGASGDLARRKVYPALFSLYCQGLLPEEFRIMGFARSDYSDEKFRERITEHLTCRYVPDGPDCAGKMETFLDRCFYVSGQYASSDSFLDLFMRMQEVESSRDVNRVFYLAIPPSLFLDVADAIGAAGFVQCGGQDPWSRVVVEKPFGRDRKSSDELVERLRQVFVEDQTYRIDHYLGKEVVQNLMVLRFANRVFEPLWNREHIARVDITWKEDLGIEGRGGYFDQYGIIRDVMQNHLLQIMALVAMEQPDRLDSREIMRQKVALLRSVAPIRDEDTILGQFKGYTDDPSVPADSLTPTFASVGLTVDNDRWRGVPFEIRAGKGLDARVNEICVQFKAVPDNIFCDAVGCPEPNQLVIRVQPDEAISLRFVNKRPGMGVQFVSRDLDLQYHAAFSDVIPDAYESLILDVIKGDKSLFIWDTELQAAWDIFTPLLHRIDSGELPLKMYDAGSENVT